MIQSLSIALSGLLASKQRADVAANNIANVTTSGSVPGDDVENPKDVYIPQEVTQTSVTTQNGDGAGVRTDVETRDPGYQLVHDPDSVFANADGFIAVPEIDLAEEIVNLQLASTIFKANAKVIEAVNEINDRLLDIEA